ncbi:MAG: hypothetical protein EU548_04755, partial [Promethearchaeota archaeon]
PKRKYIFNGLIYLESFQTWLVIEFIVVPFRDSRQIFLCIMLILLIIGLMILDSMKIPPIFTE